MKYKVGDKVLIKSIDWYNTCANNRVYVLFNDYMKKYCGQIMTINFVGGFSYNMIEDGGKYLWTDEMIEGLSASKYNKGDFVGVYGYETDVRIEEVRWNGSSYSYKVYLAGEEEWIYDDDIAYKQER